MSKRLSLGIHKGQGSARIDRSGGGSFNAMSSSQLKHLQKQNKKYTHTIKALKKNIVDSDDQDSDGAKGYGDKSGDKFGGHNSRNINNKKKRIT